MIRKGIKFRKSNRVVQGSRLPKDVRVPNVDIQGREYDSNYVTFYQCKQKPFPGAKEWKEDNWTNKTWYVKAIPITGHSRTNMAYGVAHNSDGSKWCNVYWAEDGQCYIGRLQLPDDYVEKGKQPRRIPRKTVHMDVTTHIVVEAYKDVDMSKFIENIDYNFTSRTRHAQILSTEIREVHGEHEA